MAACDQYYPENKTMFMIKQDCEHKIVGVHYLIVKNNCSIGGGAVIKGIAIANTHKMVVVWLTTAISLAGL